MLSAQEALMMQAAYDEQDRLQAQNTAGLLGATGGGLMGIAGGALPHAVLGKKEECVQASVPLVD